MSTSRLSETPQRASFRDPGGRVAVAQGRVFRLMNAQGAAEFEAFEQTACAEKFQKEKLLVTAQRADSPPPELASEGARLVVEHEAVSFPSYPYEWAPPMLGAAAALTLDLMEGALAEGFGLKDATPYNVLFRGPAPVFVDWLSFERREQRDPLWLAEAQFARTFLLPLLAARTLALPLAQVFLARREGLEPAQLYAASSWMRRLHPRFLFLVSLPVWLSGGAERRGEALYKPRRESDPQKARFMLEFSLHRLRRQLQRVAPSSDARSAWSDYMAERPAHYQEQHFALKETFVREALEKLRPRRVLDVGCNTGHFSALAAATGAEVIALDSDPVVVGRVWERARARGLDVLPLVVDLTRPSPATGWKNGECPSFLDRARGRFDLALLLAVVHHLLVGERVPLEEIVDLTAQLTRDAALVEYVGPGDPMFRRIARGREHLHADLNLETFEGAWRRSFEVVERRPLEGTDRALLLLRKKR